MYPDELKSYVLDNLIGHRLSRRTKAGYSKEYTDFVHICDTCNIGIESIFPLDLSFMEIIYRITLNSGPKICDCGNIIKESFKGRKWCSIKCRSNNKSYCKGISDIKTELYNNPSWKEETELKKTSSTLEHYGVKYPMQNIHSFEKQQAACFEKDKNGLHGYEHYVYPFLTQLYPSIQNGTTYLKNNNLTIRWIGEDNKEHRSYPDFYSQEIKSFIEIKSSYTRSLHEEKLMKCKDELYNMHYGYIICIVNPKKAFYFETYNHRYIKED